VSTEEPRKEALVAALDVRADRRLRPDRIVIGDKAFDATTGQIVPMSDAYNAWSETT
jgi:hypothetical protein